MSVFQPPRQMNLAVGYRLELECERDVPLVLTLTVPPERTGGVLRTQLPQCQGSAGGASWELPTTHYTDGFGNLCTRLVARAGRTTITSRSVIPVPATPEVRRRGVSQHPVEELPDDKLVYLFGSRYCDTDRLLEFAWGRFSERPPNLERVQEVCDFVHGLIEFGYQHADPTRSASEAFAQARGVCRDYAHLAVTLCRCLNIPTRYCTGYVSDVGLQGPFPPMDFAAWFEVYMGGEWHTFDPRNNAPRTGRVLVATGRDAADVPLWTAFGDAKLMSFEVVTEAA